MPKITLSAPFPQPLLDKIRAAASDWDIEQINLPTSHWPNTLQTEAEIFYALGRAVPNPEQAPNLRWMQVHWAGVDSIVDSPIWHSDIAITSASGIHAPNMAAYTITQILAWAHRVPNWVNYQQKAEWPDNRWDKFVPQELRGKTLGILGYGSIGREIARLAKPFGLHILVTKHNARQPADTGYTIPGTGDPEGVLPDRIYPGEATRSMAAECDYLVITLPLTPKTHHLVDEEMLRGLKSSCVLINIGRGGVIDEKALVKALNKGWIAGAGLDVFEKEPLPADSPLWQMENVLLTPHISGFTPLYDERAVDLFVTNLRRYLAGEPLLNLVDRETGY